MNGRVLIAQRPQDGLLGGMWEFPGGKRENGEALEVCLRREIREELGVQIKVGNELGVFQHAYTHFRVTLHAFACTLSKGKPKTIIPDRLKWVTPDALKDYQMGKLDRQISRTLANKR
jgi:A/G-specific adenine glycosylase